MNVAAGENVYYRLTVENIGDVPVSPVSVTDPTLDISSCIWPSTLPIGSATIDPTAVCVIGPVTAVAGDHSNAATAHGTYNSTVYNSEAASTAIYATTDLILVKSVAESKFSAAGDVLHDSYTITNNGAATCPDVDTSGDQDNCLDPSETIVCTTTDTVTAFDMSVGLVDNAASARINEKLLVLLGLPRAEEHRKIVDVGAYAPHSLFFGNSSRSLSRYTGL